MSHLLLRCLGKALLKNGVKMLASAVPFGPVLFDLAADTWEEYRQARQERGLASNSAADANLRREVEQLAPLPAAEAARLGEEIAREIAPQLPADERAALAAYLGQVPAAVRRSLRRTEDPSGKSLPANLRLQRPEDLMRFLPDRMPRFKPGERPIPSIDRELVELLGSGGFGEVWSARNPHVPDDPLVALKFCLDAQAAKSLHNEVRLLKRLEREGRHAGLVTLHATYLSADPPCLEYEYVEGGDLSGLIGEWHAPGKQPDPQQVARFILQLAETVGFVHGLKPPVVHRDLKPANILIQRHKKGDLVLKVADFGIGALVAQQALRGVSNRPMTTRHDMTMALRGAFSPLYASPQQIAGHKPEPRDDVYALGIIWYQALTGDLTQGAPSGLTWAKNLSKRGVDEGQSKLLMECFESDPAARPADAGALAVRLRNLLEPKPAPRPIPESRLQRLLPPMTLVTALVSGLVCSAIGIFWIVVSLAAMLQGTKLKLESTGGWANSTFQLLVQASAILCVGLLGGVGGVCASSRRTWAALTLLLLATLIPLVFHDWCAVLSFPWLIGVVLTIFIRSKRDVDEGQSKLLMECLESDPAARLADTSAPAIRLRNLLEPKPAPQPKPIVLHRQTLLRSLTLVLALLSGLSSFGIGLIAVGGALIKMQTDVAKESPEYVRRFEMDNTLQLERGSFLLGIGLLGCLGGFCAVSRRRWVALTLLLLAAVIPWIFQQDLMLIFSFPYLISTLLTIFIRQRR